MPFKAQLIILLASVVVSFGAGWHVKGWEVGAGQTATVEKALDHVTEGQVKTAALEAKTDETLSSDRALTTEQLNKLEASRAKNPTGYGCVVPADGMLQYRNAIARTATRAR